VDDPWIDCGFHVTEKKCVGWLRLIAALRRCARPLRGYFRLIAGPQRLKCATCCGDHSAAVCHFRDQTPVHHIDETIEGRTYHIEVSKVAQDRWRAHVVRNSGVPNAMMPFYGATPDEAARHVSEWLALAHRTARSTPSGA
jgi:hypothetical protein